MESANSDFLQQAEMLPDAPAERVSAGRASMLPTKARTGHLPTVDLMGIHLHPLTEKQTIEIIMGELAAGRGGTVVTPNLDHLYRARQDRNFAALIGESDLIVADGMPLIWASRRQGNPLPERVAGSNLITTLSEAAASGGRSVYFLGGAPGTAEAAAQLLRVKFPGLKVAGTYCPPMGFDSSAGYVVELTDILTTAAPDIIYVALGSPKQERLISQVHASLPRAWWLGVGVSFSFLCGDVKRAPLWMQRSGAEWVHRLFQEPKRLSKRYLGIGIWFGLYLMAVSVYRGVKQSLGLHQYSKPGDIPTDEGANGHSLDLKPLRSIDPARPTEARPGQAVPRSARSARVPSRQSSALPRLKALVLLGGAISPPPLVRSGIGRSVLDLPVDDTRSILAHWLDHAAIVAQQGGLSALPVRVLVDQKSPEPISANSSYYGAFRVERDRTDFRGTGGVLADLSQDYDDDDFLLVANAAQILLDPLAAIVRTLDQKRGDVGLVSHIDGTPSGIMLLRVKALRSISPVGFVDMKEQAMQKIAREYDVAVLHRRRATGVPIRTRQDYILALRYHHSFRRNKGALIDPLAEDWQPTFSIIETGASVHSSARLHDSITFAGAVVEPGAVLVRSVVCAGAQVAKDRVVIDQVLPAAKVEERLSA